MVDAATSVQARPLLKGLPVFSPIAIKLMVLVGDERVAFKEVAKLFSLDPVLSGRVLQLANSGLYGRRYPVQSVLHAVALLGLKDISRIAITAALSSGLPRETSPWIRTWWRHSVASALIADHAGLHEMELDFGYTAGLLHAIGMLALYKTEPVFYPRIVESVCDSGGDLLQCEREAFGFDHAQLSGLALAEWGLPDTLQQAVSEYCFPRAANALTAAAQTGCAYAESAGFGLCGCSQVTADAVSNKLLDQHLLTVLATQVNLIECSLI
jgi:HD-like signal output (HDOD) protein